MRAKQIIGDYGGFFEGGIENSKKPAKFPNNSQEKTRYEIGRDSVKCSFKKSTL
jgi:hypothetical protein